MNTLKSVLFYKISKFLEKEGVVYIYIYIYIYNEILLSQKKEQNNATCSYMGGPTDCHTE